MSHGQEKSYLYRATVTFVYLPSFTVNSTIDVNLAEFQYLSDHLSEKECLQLIAALHFHNFELPEDINAAESRLPDDVPCIDLLLHWNTAPGEGKGKTHIELCHRLNQIGREDLAQWLSKTVFHELRKDLQLAFNPTEAETTTARVSKLQEVISSEKITDEASWWVLDSLLEILIVIGLGTLITGSFFMCFLCCTRSKVTSKGYEKLLADEY